MIKITKSDIVNVFKCVEVATIQVLGEKIDIRLKTSHEKEEKGDILI